MKNLAFIFGFSLLFPFLSYDSLKIDDIMLLLIFFMSIYYFKSTKSHFIIVVFFLLIILWGNITKVYFNYTSSTNYSFFRALQCLAFVWILPAIFSSKRIKNNFFIGSVLGGTLTSSVIFLSAFAFLIHGGITNIYVLKRELAENFILHPNTYGIIALFTSFCSYVCYRDGISPKNKRVFFCISFLALLVPFFIFVRRDVAAVLFSFSVFLFPGLSLKNKIYCLFFVFLFSFFVLFLTSYGQTLIASLTEVSFSSGEGTSYRDVIWKSAFDSILSNPLGFGFDTEIDIINNVSGLYLGFQSHNSYLSFLLELGWFATLFFLFFIFIGYKRSTDGFLRFYLTLPLISGLFGNGLYFYKYHFYFVVIIICYILVEHERLKDV